MTEIQVPASISGSQLWDERWKPHTRNHSLERLTFTADSISETWEAKYLEDVALCHLAKFHEWAAGWPPRNVIIMEALDFWKGVVDCLRRRFDELAPKKKKDEEPFRAY